MKLLYTLVSLFLLFLKCNCHNVHNVQVNQSSYKVKDLETSNPGELQKAESSYHHPEHINPKLFLPSWLHHNENNNNYNRPTFVNNQEYEYYNPGRYIHPSLFGNYLQKPYQTTTASINGGSGSLEETFTVKIYSGFMGDCFNNSDCDMDYSTLLVCTLYTCRCPFGVRVSQFGGIVITTQWSPTTMTCEAILGSECNSDGSGISCINQQPCIQLPDRPTGVGCCGPDCVPTTTSGPSSPSSSRKLNGNDFVPNVTLLFLFSCLIYYFNIKYIQNII